MPDLFEVAPGPPHRYLYATSLSTIGLCIGLWIRAKTIGEDERANAERRALFVGLWPPTLFLMGHALRAEAPTSDDAAALEPGSSI